MKALYIQLIVRTIIANTEKPMGLDYQADARG